MSDTTQKPAAMFPVDLEGAPKITLAGREWAIPELAIGQAKKVVPAIMSIGPQLLRVAEAAGQNDAAGMMAAMNALDEAAFDKIIGIVHAALARGYPTLSRGEFEQMPIPVQELMLALPVVIKQVGFVKPATPGDAAMGEAAAGLQS